MAIDKSKYKPVGSTMTDRSWPEKGQSYVIGEGVEGLYIEKNENVGPNSANIYIIDTGEEKVGVWGNTVLDARLAGVAIGSQIAIEYLGKIPPKSGGKPYHNFFVGIDETVQPVAVGAGITDEDIPF